MSYLSLTVILLFLATLAQAQFSISGQVREAKTKSPIERASVTLHDQADSTMLAYATTNAQGSFVLSMKQFPSQPLYLKVSFVGYGAVYALVPPEKDSLRKFDILLSPQSVELREVVIATRTPAKVRGDTTIYKMDNYLKGDETTLEDVLKKMPNVRVEDNGDVFFKGKKVSKVMIDGDDIIGTNYQLATRSLDPTVLNEVQAIENYSENKLLKGLEKGVETVLNLSVKDSRKQLLFGQLGLGVGPRAHSGVANIFSYYKSLKSYASVSSNNVGIQRNESPLTSRPFGDKVDWTEFLDIQTVTSPNGLFSRNLNASYENFNREQNGSLNTSLNPNNRWKLTSNLALHRDRNQAFRQNITRFIGDNPFEFRQFNSLERRPELLNHRFVADYSPNDRTGVKIQSCYENYNLVLDQPSVFETDVLNYSIPQNIHQSRKSLYTSAELTRKLDARNAYVLAFHQGFRSVSERLNTQFPINRLPGMSNADSIRLPFLQQMNYRRDVQQAQFKWINGTENVKWDNGIAYTRQTYRIGLRQSSPSSLALVDNLSVRQQTTSFQNNLKWAFNRWELGIKQQFDYQIAELGDVKQRQWLWQRNATLRFKVDKLSSFSLGYDSSTQPLLDYQLLSAPVITDFRSIQQGVETILFNRQTQYSLSYNYSDIFARKLTLLISLFRLSNPVLWNYSAELLQPELAFSQINRTTLNATTGGNINLEKLIYSVQGSVRLDISLLSSTFEGIVNNENRLSRSLISSVRYRYSSAFESSFNVELGGYFQNNRFEVRENRTLRQSFPTASQTLTLRYQPENLTVKVAGENFSINRSNYFFVNAKANYSVNTKVGLGVEMKNILDTTTYRQVRFTSTSYVENSYPLIGRLFLLSASVSF